MCVCVCVVCVCLCVSCVLVSCVLVSCVLVSCVFVLVCVLVSLCLCSVWGAAGRSRASSRPAAAMSAFGEIPVMQSTVKAAIASARAQTSMEPVKLIASDGSEIDIFAPK